MRHVNIKLYFVREYSTHLHDCSCTYIFMCVCIYIGMLLFKLNNNFLSKLPDLLSLLYYSLFGDCVSGI